MSSETNLMSQAQPSQRQSGVFLRRLTAATGGGMFLDGYVFAAIAAVIAGGTFTSDLGVSPLILA
ncbi:hypothetical protein [Pseudarthrobacter sp. SSS035]|uniref:hypothetical protein n=1 Tax=Pseudarthrobacter sp. SSS035 TaxID=2931399 RepID=UPI00200FFD91|nr:hypothetical protein [Pseudarthrobacter sp. SSS035]